jgi:PAS domain S-box-containing protein
MATILVVDDPGPSRDFLVTLLGSAGHRLLEGSDTDEALAIARSDHLDLVIADILMPTTDGAEFVRVLRADPATANIPVIFWSAEYQAREARQLARSCGSAWTLMKPSTPEAVLTTVSAALGRAEPALAAAAEKVDRGQVRALTDTLSETVDQLRVTTLRLESLIEIDLQMATERDPIRLLEGYCGGARNLFGARYAALYVFDPRAPTAHHFCVRGLSAEMAPNLAPSDPLRGVLAEVVETQRAVSVQNPGGEPVALGLPASHPKIRSMLAAPIAALSHSYGWLYLADKVGVDGFSDDDKRLLSMLSRQLGRVYENGRAFAETERRAAALAAEVAERRAAEQSLRRNEESTHFALETAGIGIWEADLVTDVSRWSEIQERLHGLPPGGFQGTSAAFLKTIHPADRKSIAEALSEAHKSKTDVNGIYRTVWPDGSVHWIHGHGRFSYDDRGVPTRGTGVTIDITERRLLEEQYLQSQKMEAVGQLAGGVAHDFNNLLTVILGYVELMAPSFAVGDKRQNDIDQIRKAATRATYLTRQLLAFSRRQILQPTILDVNALVTDLASLLRRLIGEDVELNLSLAAGTGRIKADSGQIEQVVMNLAINACDAMPGGGRLTIETANVDANEEFFRRHAVRNETGDRHFVQLVVSDTGTGMDAETQRRIFEPFFTTKPQGKGTGLGLATVYGIVKQSGGWIWVYSEPGEGATFKVYLPRNDEEIVREKFVVSERLRGGNETILLVEDEDAVRSLSHDLLERQGYRVIDAADAEQALATSSGEAQPIHLLLTDVVMPGQSGPELFKQLQPIRPDMKVLYVSGYTDEAIVKRGILTPGTAFLQKPFTASGFLRKVREVLDAGGRS